MALAALQNCIKRGCFFENEKWMGTTTWNGRNCCLKNGFESWLKGNLQLRVQMNGLNMNGTMIERYSVALFVGCRIRLRYFLWSLTML